MEEKGKIFTEVAEASPTDVVETTATTEQPSGIGWHNVERENGVALSLVGMLIVFTGLVLTFCYISLLPKVFGERPAKPPKHPEPVAKDPVEDSESADSDLTAAIAYVVAAEL